jgi:catechol 2,3-dioxygenase-like lactoylglutathione lyase family enzyme
MRRSRIARRVGKSQLSEAKEDKHKMSLSTHKVRPSIAVSDISRAAEFYEGKLGLRAGAEQSDESRVYPCGGGTSLHVYVSPAPSVKGTETLATWYVSELDRVVDELGSAGVTFERYDDPALQADEKGIHELDDGRVAWFKDPDGNTFAIEQ